MCNYDEIANSTLKRYILTDIQKHCLKIVIVNTIEKHKHRYNPKSPSSASNPRGFYSFVSERAYFVTIAISVMASYYHDSNKNRNTAIIREYNKQLREYKLNNLLSETN